MAWEDIIPQRGLRVNLSPGVTMAWRAKAGSKPAMYICIAAHVARELGWQPKQRVLVQRDLSAGLMRLARSDDKNRTYSLHGATGARCLAVMPRPTGLDHLTEGRPSAEVAHRIEKGALIMEMPAWAIPDHARPQDAKSEPPPPAAPPPAARPAAASPPPPYGQGQRTVEGGRAALPAVNPHKAEAVKMLEAGIPPRTVAGDMGLPMADVANWAHEVRARKQGRAA